MGKKSQGIADKVIKNPIAYTIKDKVFDSFDVKNSANAWWIDKTKVENLINAYKWDAPDEEAIINAGISLVQLDYFKKNHSDFSRVKTACKEIPNLRARQTVVTKATESYANAMDYLKRKKKLEFGDGIDVTSAGKPIAIQISEVIAKKNDINRSPESNS